MSGFISSLFIDPVFRQARRLSRRSSSDRLPSPIPGHPSILHASAPSSISWPSARENNYDAPATLSPESTGPQINSASLESAISEALPSSVPLTVERGRRVVDEPGDNGYVSHSGVLYDRDSIQEDIHADPEDQRLRQPFDLSSNLNSVEAGIHVSQDSPMDTTQRLSWDGKEKSALPEDDGMGHLRRKIHAIRDKDIPNPEKARLILNLMTKNYRSSQASSNNVPHSPASLRSVDRPWTPASHRSRHSFDQLSLTPASTVSVPSLSNPYNLAPEDLKPTFAPKDDEDKSEEDVDDDESEEVCLGCPHYKRNVKLQCYTCKRWYTCRFCHDKSEDHTLDRRQTENMLCMLCGCPQPASHRCIGCGEKAAWYYCSKCKLWDNDEEKSIYHCNDCGICRIGQGLGKDFFHCKTCSVCMPISIENTHRCIERSTQCDCPLCGEYMFTSPETVVFMRCGHSIHQKCFSEYSRQSYRCPLCSKSITNMESQFRNLDRTIASQPMPPEFKDTKALIYCNDCSIKSAVPYHWLGLKCDMCESYNTVQIQLLSGNESDDTQQGHTDDHTQPSLQAQAPDGREQENSTEAGTTSLNDPSLLATSSASHDTGLTRIMRQSRSRRPISPVISNYFGLPTERESAKSSSKVSLAANKSDDNGDDLHFWGSASIVSRYRFIGSDAASTDGESETVEDDQDSAEHTGGEESEEEEDDDDGESIELFGHR